MYTMWFFPWLIPHRKTINMKSLSNFFLKKKKVKEIERKMKDLPGEKKKNRYNISCTFFWSHTNTKTHSCFHIVIKTIRFSHETRKIRLTKHTYISKRLLLLLFIVLWLFCHRFFSGSFLLLFCYRMCVCFICCNPYIFPLVLENIERNTFWHGHVVVWLPFFCGSIKSVKCLLCV